MEHKEENKICQNCKNSFTIEPDDFSFYEKVKVPPPTFCPECRRQRRLTWRTEFNFYNRKCDMCERDIISSYPARSTLKVYCNKCWWSDNWDPKSYERDIDWGKSFFDQLQELRESVPVLSLINDNNVGSINCEYTQNFVLSKNCYMCMVAWHWDDCMYSCYGADARNCVDCMGLFGSCENCYESIFIEKCYGCKFVYQSTSMVNSSFCFDCRNCDDCFMCTGLRNKKFYFKNKKYSEEEYKEIVSNYAIHTYTGQQKAIEEFRKFKLENIHPYAFLKNCTSCTGGYLFNSKNSQNSYNARNLEDCYCVDTGDTMKECRDISVGGEAELCYEGVTPDNSHDTAFTNYTWKSSSCYYCDFCQSCNDCFGCVSLKKGEYCILNKQYSKAEYLEIKNKLIEHMKSNGEWGEFFRARDSFFGYNETIANFHFPLSKEQALREGYKWQDSLQITTGKETLDISAIEDDINNISDSIINETIACTSCSRNYRITENELLFYRKMNIPLPRNCFFCRLNNRFNFRNPSKLWHRSCMKEGCNNEFETSYAPERPEIVYCEKCYQQEVI